MSMSKGESGKRNPRSRGVDGSFVKGTRPTPHDTPNGDTVWGGKSLNES